MATPSCGPPPLSATPDERPALPFLVAGVGASAGGQEANTELLEALPARPRFTMLLVSQLDPAHKRRLNGDSGSQRATG
jgi:chemotaxis response regulator CheB